MSKTKTSAKELTRSLLAYRTINPPGDERACAHFLGALLSQAGFETRYHEFAEGRTTLVARKGSSPDRGPIVFTGHIDTVPLGTAAWSHDPFAGEVDGDRVYGRGASDMKSGVAAMVLAALRTADYLSNSPGVVLVLTAGEETGHEGVKHLAATPGLLGSAGAIVVGEPTENYPLVGSRGSLKLEFVVPGKTAHASTPELGVNAVVRAARLAAALDEYRFDIDPHPVMGKPSLNIGYLRGGININSVPDEACLGIDIRTISGQDHNHIQGQMQCLACAGTQIRRLRETPMTWTEPDQEWVQKVYEIATPYLGAPPEARVATYGTDGPWLTEAMGGPPTLILGPGELSTMHATDEWTSITRLENGQDIYEQLIRHWCRI